MRAIIAGALILFLAVSMATAEIYKWVDEKGTVHFTEDPATIPEKYREKAKSRTTEEDLMTLEERARDKQEGEDAARRRVIEDRKAYEKSLMEEKTRHERRRREIDQIEERLKAEKEEKARRLEQSEQEPKSIERIDPPILKQREEKRIECSNCYGKGYIPCVRCNPGGGFQGTRFKGKIEKTIWGTGGPRTMYVTCPDCGGVGEKRCSQCNGVGYVWRK